MSGPELLAQVLAAPEEDPPRLVYADYLMEQGDPRGELIAVQVQLTQRITPARRKLARRREQELLAQNKFGDEVTKGIVQLFKLRRGFVDEVWASGQAFANGAAKLLDKEPVRVVNLNGVKTAHLEKLLASGVIGRLVGLRISGDEIDLADLAASEQLRSLRRLNLSRAEIGDAGLKTLLDGGNLRVESLTLNECGITDEGAIALAGSEAMRHIKKLFMSRNEIGDEGAAALARSPHMGEMGVISLGGNFDVGPDGGQAFADVELAARVKRLEIDPSELDNATIEAIRAVWGDRFRG
jgi:uncharacterized protein (TIGR02996 family)